MDGTVSANTGNDEVRRKMKAGLGKRIAAYLLALVMVSQLSWTGAPLLRPSAEERYLPEALNLPGGIPEPEIFNSFSFSDTPAQYEITEPQSETAEPHGNPTETAKQPADTVPDTAGIRHGIPRELPETGEQASELISAETGGIVCLGDASITIPPGALETDTEIQITRLFITGETGELHNATSGGGGYRFTPAGQRFLKEAEIRLPYEAGLKETPAVLEELTTYYFDTEKGRWEALKRIGLDEEHGVLVSATTHFTDMINGTLSLPEGPEPLSFNINSIKGLEAADPSAGVLQMEGLEGNYMGNAGFRFVLAVPAGRAGMTPQVTIGYSSDGGNGILGKGWSLEAGGEITYDTRRGLPDYKETDAEKKGPFMLDGVVLEYYKSENGAARYRPLKEIGYERILHYTGEKDYWEVTDKRGTKRVYGKHGENEDADASWTGIDSGSKYRWLLESVTDSFGNRIRYEYSKAAG